MDEGRLIGRRVLVVGASAGIGRVIGQRLVAAGAHVAFAFRRKDACQEAAEETGGKAIGLQCDVADEAQCLRLVADTVEGLGSLDDVVYSASAISLVGLEEANADWWRRNFETNVLGAAMIIKSALSHLKQSNGGSVVHLSSVSSIGPVWPGVGVYTSTKAALNWMVETRRSEPPKSASRGSSSARWPTRVRARSST